MKETIQRLIFEAIDETNELLDEEQQLKKELSAKLYGPGSQLDSLELVNLVISVEQKIEEFYAVEITLADERVMQMKFNPFSNVERFVDYVFEMVSEQKK